MRTCLYWQLCVHWFQWQYQYIGLILNTCLVVGVQRIYSIDEVTHRVTKWYHLESWLFWKRLHWETAMCSPILIKNVNIIIEFWLHVLSPAFKVFYISDEVTERVTTPSTKRKDISDVVIHCQIKLWKNWSHNIFHIKIYKILNMMLLIIMFTYSKLDIYLFIVLRLFYHFCLHCIIAIHRHYHFILFIMTSERFVYHRLSKNPTFNPT